MNLGASSISLSVSDLVASRDFYAKLGFEPFGGDLSQNWLMLKNGDHVIGLFQGMFDSNVMTFNPGWDQNGQELNPFTDVRDIQAKLKSEGITLLSETGEGSSGPASIMLEDPDGNQILIDQHR